MTRLMQRAVAVLAAVQAAMAARMVRDDLGLIQETTSGGCDDIIAKDTCEKELVGVGNYDTGKVTIDDVASKISASPGSVEALFGVIGLSTTPTCHALCQAASDNVQKLLHVEAPRSANTLCEGKDCEKEIRVGDGEQNLDLGSAGEIEGKVDIGEKLAENERYGIVFAGDMGCECQEWNKGAMFTDAHLCWKVEAGIVQCEPPDMFNFENTDNGQCNSGYTLCTAGSDLEPNLPNMAEREDKVLRRLLGIVFNMYVPIEGAGNDLDGTPSALFQVSGVVDPRFGPQIDADFHMKTVVNEALSRGVAWLSHAIQKISQGQANGAMQTWLGQSDPAFAKKMERLANTVVAVLNNAVIRNGLTDSRGICTNHVAPIAYVSGSPTGCVPGNGCGTKERTGRYQIWLCPKAFDWSYLGGSQWGTHGHSSLEEALAAIIIHEGFHHASVPQIVDQSQCSGMVPARQCGLNPATAQANGYNYQHMISEAAVSISGWKATQGAQQIQQQIPVQIPYQQVPYQQVPYQQVIHQAPQQHVHVAQGAACMPQSCSSAGKCWGISYGHKSLSNPQLAFGPADCVKLHGVWTN